MLERYTKKELAKLIQFTNVKAELTRDELTEHLRTCADYGFHAAMISPCWVFYAKGYLKGTGVRVATTVNFPQGTDTLGMKVAAVRLIAKEGADEFDFPPNPAFLLSGMEEEYFRELEAVCNAAHEEGMQAKAMLEFGYLPTRELKAKAVQLACMAKVDWAKNSSGWGAGGSPATVEDMAILKENLSGMTKIKASGKVNSYKKMDELFAAGAALVGTSSAPAIMDGLEGDEAAY